MPRLSYWMRFNFFPYFFFIILTFNGIFTIKTNPVKADFGDAEAPTESISMKNNYDAWCAKKGNKCTVDFISDSIVINKKNAVKYSQIIDFSHKEKLHTCGPIQIVNCQRGGDTFYINYQKNNGQKGQGVILFGNKKVAVQFLSKMKQISRESKYTDPRCERYGDVVFKGICMSKAESFRETLNDQERKNKAVNDAINQGMQNYYKERELNIKEREADAKVFESYNNQNRPNTNIYIYE